MVDLTFDDWLRLGVEAGWVTPPFCLTHDGIPATVDEAQMAAADDPLVDDLCTPVVRVLPHGTRLAPFPPRWNRTPLNDTTPLSPEVAAGIRLVVVHR